MKQPLTLAGVIDDFVKKHPEYRPNVLDIDRCLRYLAQNFMYVFASTDSVTYALRNKVMCYEYELEKLREENRLLKK